MNQVASRGLFFDPQSGRGMFHRNVDWISMDHRTLYFRRQRTFHNLHRHCCENLKPQNVIRDLPNKKVLNTLQNLFTFTVNKNQNPTSLCTETGRNYFCLNQHMHPVCETQCTWRWPHQAETYSKCKYVWCICTTNCIDGNNNKPLSYTQYEAEVQYLQ
jgi:hypothetical protein